MKIVENESNITSIEAVSISASMKSAIGVAKSVAAGRRRRQRHHRGSGGNRNSIKMLMAAKTARALQQLLARRKIGASWRRGAAKSIEWQMALAALAWQLIMAAATAAASRLAKSAKQRSAKSMHGAMAINNQWRCKWRRMAMASAARSSGMAKKA